jgi:Tfp pilus assembly ATPase PilU
MSQAEYKKELEELILTVIHEGASDLHLVSGRHPTIRVSGELVPLVKKPLLPGDAPGASPRARTRPFLPIFPLRRVRQ